MRTAALACLTLALFAPASSAQLPDEDDVYISVVAFEAIYRYDVETGQFTPFATGLQIPFYGEWFDGHLYIPERGAASIVKIDPAGNVTTLASGVWTAPVTVAVGPDEKLYVSDIFANTIVKVDPDSGDVDLFVSNTSGLFDGAGGLGFDLDGVLYVSNFTANDIIAVQPDGSVSVATDGGGLIGGPGGVQIDGAGNLFVANYNFGTITRTRLDTDETTVFCADPVLVSPNDVKLSNEGRLLTTTKVAALVEMDITGASTTIYQDTFYGEFDGIAIPADFPRCTGRQLRYGSGTTGLGGVVPSMRGLFSPCPGAQVGVEIEKARGGAPATLFWSLAPAAIPFKGGELLVAFGGPMGQVPLVLPGNGAGGGALLLPVDLPNDPVLAGASIFLQTLVGDPAATGGVALSNGLELRIGQ